VNHYKSDSQLISFMIKRLIVTFNDLKMRDDTNVQVALVIKSGLKLKCVH